MLPYSSPEVVKYVVPLMGFEKKLVADVRQYRRGPHAENMTGTMDNGPQDQADHHPEAFASWKWGSSLEKSLRECLDTDADAFKDEWGGDRAKAYGSCLRAQDKLGKHLKRIQMIRECNADFLGNLGDVPARNIKVVPAAQDGDEWKTLSEIVDAFGRPWDPPDTLDLDHGRFEILQLVRIFFTHSIYPSSPQNIRCRVINSAKFAQHFRVGDPAAQEGPRKSPEAPGSFPSLQIRKKHAPEDLIPMPEMPRRGEELSSDNLNQLLRRLGQERLYPNPQAFLHFIPWDELTPVSSQCDIEHLSCHLPGSHNGTRWMLWTPPIEGFGCNHHLHVEDELLEYSMERHWHFPGHEIHQKVVFALTPLAESAIIPGLGAYWTEWNDCAVTRDEGAQESYILETIPGMIFRFRIAHTDHTLAVRYYRALVEDHAAGDLAKSDVKDLLGLEQGYTPLFEKSLRIIPASQLSPFDWNKPLGKGRNGRVYASTWTRQKGVLATSKAGDVSVVLKDILSSGARQSSGRSKFMKELDVTYASLGGSAIACVEFFGLSHVSGPDGAENRLMFVLERATKGTVVDFLACHLRGMDFYSSWRELTNCIASIANGIYTIHRHKVVHRDLHLNNILVTDRFFPNDAMIPHEYSFLISDLGEGKNLGQFSTEVRDMNPTVAAFASYGVVDFRAPELKDGTTKSTTPASEVFSFAVIACKLMDCREYVCCSTEQQPPPDIQAKASSAANMDAATPGSSHECKKEPAPRIVPTRMRDAISSCLSHHKDDRPSMRKVLDDLEDLSLEFTAEELDGGGSDPSDSVKWCCWEWNAALAAARRGKNARVHESGEADFWSLSGR